MCHTTLISTETLAAHLDGSWVDRRLPLRPAQRRRGDASSTGAAHIPGAVYASLSHDLAAPPTGTNGRHPLPCVEDIDGNLRPPRHRAGHAGRDLRPGHRACSRAACGGCCATWDTTRPRCSTAAGRNGRAKDGRSVPGDEQRAAPRSFTGRRREGAAAPARRRCRQLSAIRPCCSSTRARPSASRARASRSTARRATSRAR